MGAVERMTITMPAELAETLRQTVAGGEYASTSEVVREALRDWTRSRDPDRILPLDDKAERELRKRTLTNLYNARPAWLDHAHKALDEAVAGAYGWGDDWRAGALTDDEILARLFHLNQQRTAR